MASKKHLLGGVTLKVENMSGFDKSRFNAFTAPLGAIVPMVKQLCLPGKINLRVNLSAQLPPLATDAFLRSHLKVEAFSVPLRLCYGGFQSWFSGEKIVSSSSSNPFSLGVAKLPYLNITTSGVPNQTYMNNIFGVHTLMDYFGVKWPLSSGVPDASRWPSSGAGLYDLNFNIFPFIAYQLCYHHWYRNKLIQRPLFAPPAADVNSSLDFHASALPYVSFVNRVPVGFNVDDLSHTSCSPYLLNAHLLALRQRNYGYDYFTTALPSAQDGSPMSVSTSGGQFTISALRLANSLQQFAERNQVAGPDYVQTLRARYNRAPSMGVASRPILLGSADFPMFTSGVEQTSGYSQASTGNPMAGIAARFGRAHAEGSDFVCEAEIDEPSYLMVMVSLVPEANYASGFAKDMTIFTAEGSIVDLPCAELERAGMQEIECKELYMSSSQWSAVFGYQPRYMWHKAGAQNEIHGLFRKGASLEAFIPQRDFNSAGSPPVQISDAFLEVHSSDLDNITAVAGAISQYGVLIDSKIDLFVSEPLGESVMPSLVDPGAEHGQSVYVSRGGISVNNV